MISLEDRIASLVFSIENCRIAIDSHISDLSRMESLLISLTRKQKAKEKREK